MVCRFLVIIVFFMKKEQKNGIIYLDMINQRRNTMKECLLCERDMKTAKTIFGNGCIKSIYKLLNLKMPKKANDREQYLYKSIMKKVNAKNLNSNQKVWLADRYLTYQYVKNLKYGDYNELKNELSNDIANIGEIENFSEFKTADKVKLKQAYTLYRKEEKFDTYLTELGFTQKLVKRSIELIFGDLPIKLKKSKNLFEMSAIDAMQYALWETVVLGGLAVGYDTSAGLLQHSLKENPGDIVITEGNVVDEIKNDAQFQAKIKEIVQKYGKNADDFTAFGKDTAMHFNNSDLYFSIHSADMVVKGKKENEKWNLEIELTDIYDYTDFKEITDYYKDANSIPKSMFSSFIYNLAYFSVKFGIIKEYKIIIRFNINGYEVN